jgi:malic enzyme
MKICILGGGSAGMGVAGGLSDGMVAMQNGPPEGDKKLKALARKQFYMLDVDGLITCERDPAKVKNF